MSDNQIIRAKLRRLLPTLDLETATQRTIQQQLEDELGISLDAHKALLKAEVDAFLLGQVPADDENEEHDTKEPAAKKQKHAVTSPDKGGAETTTHGPPGYIFSVPISSKRHAGVRTYNGRPMVDIREFYVKDGQQAPGIKGLSHNPNQWAALTAGMQALTDALSNGDESFFLDLGGNKRAGVSIFGGKVMVNLREFYDKDGKMLPGKKGISMPPDQWAKLCAAHEELTEKLRASGGNPTSPAPPTATKTTHQAGEAAGPSEAGPSTLATGAGSEGAVVSVVLAPLRRAEVVTFKGKLAVDIREFYEKDGKLAHTKKGLQLQPEQFAILKDRAGEITAALEGQDTAFEVLLTPKRKITISNFKGRYSVDLREYYEKDGVLAPGQKGLSLSAEQWTKLCDALPMLDTALKGQGAA